MIGGTFSIEYTVIIEPEAESSTWLEDSEASESSDSVSFTWWEDDRSRDGKRFLFKDFSLQFFKANVEVSDVLCWGLFDGDKGRLLHTVPLWLTLPHLLQVSCCVKK